MRLCCTCLIAWSSCPSHNPWLARRFAAYGESTGAWFRWCSGAASGTTWYETGAATDGLGDSATGRLSDTAFLAVALVVGLSVCDVTPGRAAACVELRRTLRGPVGREPEALR